METLNDKTTDQNPVEDTIKETLQGDRGKRDNRDHSDQKEKQDALVTFGDQSSQIRASIDDTKEQTKDNLIQSKQGNLPQGDPSHQHEQEEEQKQWHKNNQKSSDHFQDSNEKNISQQQQSGISSLQSS